MPDDEPRISAEWGRSISPEDGEEYTDEAFIVAPTPVDGRPQDDERRRSGSRVFTLFASGADQRILADAEVDESEFVVQGSLVILTSMVAVVAALSAAAYLVEGRFVVTPATVMVALAWGALIFFFDRALVSGSLNPYRFSRIEVKSFSDPQRATHWTFETGRTGLARQLGDAFKVLTVASLRIALALATSFIISEMVLLLIFQKEVDDRTEFILQQQRQSGTVAIEADFKQQNDARAARRAELTGIGDTQLARLNSEITALEKQQDNAKADLIKLQDAAAKEEDGVARQYVLSDGTPIRTTGGTGRGRGVRTLLDQAATEQTVVSDLAQRLDTARQEKTSRQSAILAGNKAALGKLTDLDNKAPAAQQAAVDKLPPVDASHAGLLLRRDALYQLEHDTNPQTLELDKLPPCHGPFGWLCSLRNSYAPPTPMGPEVVAFRAVFLIIEIFPITYKVISSLRRRRPYDAVRASREIVAHAEAFGRADRSQHAVSRTAIARLNERRGWPLQPPTVSPDVDPHDADPPWGDAWPTVTSRLEPVSSGAAQGGLPPRVPAQRKPAGQLFDADPRRPTFKVVMVGGQRAGKTALLAAMYRELSRGAEARGYQLQCTDVKQLERLRRNGELVADAGPWWPPKTELGEIEEYRFECRIIDGLTSDTVLDVHYWDYAGDLYEDPGRETQRLTRQLNDIVRTADALLLAVDGEILLKAMLGVEAFGVDPGNARWALERMMLNLSRVTRTDNHRVVHLLVTKWDLFESAGVQLGAVRTYLLDELDVRGLVVERTRLVRLIPVAATEHVVTPEVQPTAGVIQMVKQHDRRTDTTSLSVLFAALLPDRIEAIVSQMNDNTIARQIRQAKHDRRQFVVAAGMASVLSFGGRLKKIRIPGFFSFEKEAAELRNAWVYQAFARRAQRFQHAGEWLRELKQLKDRATGTILLRSRINIVERLRRDLDAFTKKYPDSKLTAGRGDRQ